MSYTEMSRRELMEEIVVLERRLAEVEGEIKSLKVQRRIDSDHRAMYCQMKNDAESHLRAASDWIKAKRRSKDFAFTVGFISSDELDELEAALCVSSSSMGLEMGLSTMLKPTLENKNRCLGCGLEIDDEEDLYEGYGCPRCHSPLVVKITKEGEAEG